LIANESDPSFDDQLKDGQVGCNSKEREARMPYGLEVLESDDNTQKELVNMSEENQLPRIYQKHTPSHFWTQDQN